MSVGPVVPPIGAAAREAATQAMDAALTAMMDKAQASSAAVAPAGGSSPGPHGASPPAPAPEPPAAASASAPAAAPLADARSASAAAQGPAATPSALTVMVARAAAEQSGLAPLFADLAAAAAAPDLPAPVRLLVAQILAAQSPLTEAVTPQALRTAAQSSGLFLEANLAAQVLEPGAAPPPLAGDLKALLVRLIAGLAAAQPPAAPTPPASAAPPGDAPPVLARPPLPTSAAALAPTIAAPDAPPSEPPPMAATPQGVASPATPQPADRAAAARPAPPVQGAIPRGQPAAVASADIQAGGARLVHVLRQDAHAALARVELGQAASLPRPNQPTLWSLDAPVATPTGPAIAQFEIRRDGGGDAAAVAQPTWRARFSLDVEPSGPVHADVALSGGRTRVTLWAERPDALASLGARQAELSAALTAEDSAADVAVRVLPGAPARSPPMAGQLVDRRS